VYEIMSTTGLHDLYRSTDIVQDCMAAGIVQGYRGAGIVQGYNVQK
jgi:hypothetical protein